jgi:hypothetical protein
VIGDRGQAWTPILLAAYGLLSLAAMVAVATFVFNVVSGERQSPECSETSDAKRRDAD